MLVPVPGSVPSGSIPLMMGAQGGLVPINGNSPGAAAPLPKRERSNFVRRDPDADVRWKHDCYEDGGAPARIAVPTRNPVGTKL
jgi:hypothetical protein